MATETSPAPWDLATCEKWGIESRNPHHGGDRNNEVIVDAKGNVVAYVSGFNDEGGNGSLLAAAPALLDALERIVNAKDGCPPDDDWKRAEAALKKAGWVAP